jgi:DNA-binding XRE family transcriptional regulator
MPMRTFHGRQIAAARALANVSAVELARDAGVTARTIGLLEVDAPTDKIRGALARLGVELLPEGEDHGAGVRCGGQWPSSCANSSPKNDEVPVLDFPSRMRTLAFEGGGVSRG